MLIAFGNSPLSVSLDSVKFCLLQTKLIGEKAENQFITDLASDVSNLLSNLV